ncbi:MAG TPA: hypothetical protein VGJ84_06665 [Polyangiaceae bacterium]
MPPLVNSFDVFDTLLARRCVEPRLLFLHLEARAGLPGLAAGKKRGRSSFLVDTGPGGG